jgi:hypothetical protein
MKRKEKRPLSDCGGMCHRVRYATDRGDLSEGEKAYTKTHTRRDEYG